MNIKEAKDCELEARSTVPVLVKVSPVPLEKINFIPAPMDIVPALLKLPSDILRVPDSTVKVVPLEVEELPLVLDKVKSFLRVKLPDVKDNLEIPTSDPLPASF